jgi:hypothetical protein
MAIAIFKLNGDRHEMIADGEESYPEMREARSISLIVRDCGLCSCALARAATARRDARPHRRNSSLSKPKEIPRLKSILDWECDPAR